MEMKVSVFRTVAEYPSWMMYLKTPRYDIMFKLDTPYTSTALEFRYHKVVNLDQSRGGNEEIAAIFVQQLLVEE